MQHVVPLKTDRTLPPELLLEQWRVYLQEYDRSNGTVKKYTHVFDTRPGPPTGPDDDPQDLGQFFKKVFLNT